MSSSRSIRRGVPGELLKHMIRAARLDASLYREVQPMLRPPVKRWRLWRW
jgi:hypothetical protein